MNLSIISAGAGSGKTYRLTQDMVALLRSGEVRAAGIIATTFTKKAAAELQERVRTKLLEEGLREAADDLNNALIGTVHGLGVKLLKRFAYEAGVSPEVSIIAAEDQQILFNQSLSQVLTNARVVEMQKLADRLGFTKSKFAITDWRKLLLTLTEIARNNDFDRATLERSRRDSFESFAQLLGTPSERSAEEWHTLLRQELNDTIERLENNADTTKGTNSAVTSLKGMRTTLDNLGELPWYDWVKISKTKVGAKSRDDFQPLQTFAKTHDRSQAFRADIKAMIDNLFELSIEAIDEYQAYKKTRGLIDYTDMEALIRELLKNEKVQRVLSEELDLLMVDEFQDTSPLQLEIFWQLTRLAKKSIWVGDPKQSIYGFRGAEPELMKAVVDHVYPEGIPEANINPNSYRSRRDIVHATNAIFTKAFAELPERQVALGTVRTPEASGPGDLAALAEPAGMPGALHHWHAVMEGEKPRYNKTWSHGALAEKVAQLIERAPLIFDKHLGGYRKLQPGDIAVLCRTNKNCGALAEALHRAGVAVAMSRNGLLQTTEARFISACLKFILNRGDSLSVATILLLSNRKNLSEIIDDRLDYLTAQESERGINGKWASHNDFIQKLDELRQRTEEYSSAEILNLLLEELDLRRIIASWGKAEQRLGNVDELRALALAYEEKCNRLHTAASLAGFLLYLLQIEREERDAQASGAGPEAVNLLTYHRSKGLEWPVVICYDLSYQLRERTLDFSLMSDRKTLDPQAILGGRWLRLWINPYADQLAGTNLSEALDHHPAKAESLARAAAEEARLLYVGITRARDLLVFPTTPKDKATWLNRICNEGDEKQATLDPQSDLTPWIWAQRTLPIQAEVDTYAASFAEQPRREVNPLFLETKPRRQDHPALRIDASDAEWIARTSHRCAHEYDYAEGLPVSENKDDNRSAARALKQFIAADHPGYPETRRHQIASGLLQRHGVGEALGEAQFLKISSAFYKFLDTHYPGATPQRHLRIRAPFRAQLFETYLDLLLPLEGKLIVVQHSGYSGAANKCKNQVKNLRAWAQLTRETLRKMYPGREIVTMIHFPFSGQLLELETGWKKGFLRETQLSMDI